MAKHHGTDYSVGVIQIEIHLLLWPASMFSEIIKDLIHMVYNIRDPLNENSTSLFLNPNIKIYIG